MSKIFRLSVLAIILLALTGCNLPSGNASPTPDYVATQVSTMLTAQPSATAMVVLPTATNLPEVQTATLTPSPSETNTLTPTATGTAVTGDPRTLLGTPTGTDTLDTGKNFGLDGTSYDDGFTFIRVENGALVLTSRNASDYHGWRTGGVKLKNAYVEVTIQTGTCSGSDLYGLIVRSPDFVKGYRFQLTCEGNWNFTKYDGSQEEELKSGTNTDNAILTGSNQTNRLGVMASGNDFKLFVNGVQLGEVSDDTFQDAGAYGVIIAGRKTPDFTIYTQEFNYWTLK